MYVARVSDGLWLINQARRTHHPIHVSTAHIVAPNESGHPVPALLLQYSVSDNVQSMTWTFQEVRFPDPVTNQVPLDGTLLATLRGLRDVVVDYSHRSGSL